MSTIFYVARDNRAVRNSAFRALRRIGIDSRNAKYYRNLIMMMKCDGEMIEIFNCGNTIRFIYR
jgi:hypothetical protein